MFTLQCFDICEWTCYINIILNNSNNMTGQSENLEKVVWYGMVIVYLTQHISIHI